MPCSQKYTPPHGFLCNFAGWDSFCERSILRTNFSFVFENNVFEHNGKFYKQIPGTEIGTMMAPNYAILFMSELEERILNSSPLRPYGLVEIYR